MAHQFWRTSILACLLCACYGQDQNDVNHQPPVRYITVGAVLSSNETGRIFKRAIDRVNTELPDSIHFNATFILMHDNPIKAATAICDKLIPEGVYVVIASQPKASDLSPMAVSFTCGFYEIPVIGISARNSAFSDKVRLTHYITGLARLQYLQCISSGDTAVLHKPSTWFVYGNIKICLHFLSFLDSWQSLLKSLHKKDWDPCTLQSLPWLLMTWRCKKPGHQQPWYWRSSPRIFWFQ